MKNLSVASKALTLLFAAVFLVACSGNKEKEMAEVEEASKKRLEAKEKALDQTLAMAKEDAASQQRCWYWHTAIRVNILA